MIRKEDIYEADEIEAVFDFLTVEKNITDISETGGVSTITTSSVTLLDIIDKIYLQAGQIVTLNKINYSVIAVSISAKTFTITATGLYHMSTDPIPVKVLDVTKWNLAINFKFGSRNEINKILNIEDKDTNKKNIRFPLAWLFINEAREHDSLEYDYKTSLKLAFVHLTNIEYTAEQRLDNVFKKVLQPLETLFLETIRSPYFSRVFNWEYMELNYKDYYRYFYGSSDKNQMVLTAPTDAIEIDLDVIFQNQY